MNSPKQLILLFGCVVLFHTISCGVITQQITDELAKAKHNIDCGLKRIGDFLGLENMNGDPCLNPNGLTQPSLSGQTNFDLGFGQNFNRIEYGDTIFQQSSVRPEEKFNSNFDGSINFNRVSETAQLATAPSVESTTKSINMEGRRIISAHSNCPAGYKADSRGRCREAYF